MSLLERMYPVRCYDCLGLLADPDEVICPACKAKIKEARKAR